MLTVTIGELVEKDGRGFGQRVMTAELLTKAASRMSDLGERIAYAAMRSWLPGGEKAPAKSTLRAEIQKLQVKEAAAKAAGEWRDAAYYEVAAFCCEARVG